MLRYPLLSTSSCTNCPPRHSLQGVSPTTCSPPYKLFGGNGWHEFLEIPLPSSRWNLRQEAAASFLVETSFYWFPLPKQARKTPWSSYYVLSYLDLAHVPYFLPIGLFAILSVSLQALRFEVRSFDNFKDCQSQLTHCCQVFLGRPCSRLLATSCCVHFFIQSSLRQTWPNQRKWFVCSVISRFFKCNLFNKLSGDILSQIFTLHIQRIIARSFLWSLWTSAVVRVQLSLPHNITMRMHPLKTLPLLFKGIAWLVNKGKLTKLPPSRTDSCNGANLTTPIWG